MPNQNPTQDPQKVQVIPPGSIPVQTDLPPLPPDFQNVPADDPIVSPVNDSGSAAPPDSDLPPIITTPKKKFGGGKIIATILGIFLLVGGVGTGVYLVRQQQTVGSKAAYWQLGDVKYYDREQYDSAVRTLSEDDERQSDVNVVNVIDNAAAQQAAQSSTSNECGGPGQKQCEVVCEGDSCHYGNVSFDKNNPPQGINCTSGSCLAQKGTGNCAANTGNCFVNTNIGVTLDGKEVCNGPHWTTCAAGYTCSNGDCVPPQLNQSSGSDTPPPSDSSSAVCQNVKAYDSVWTPLTSADLSALSTGTVVNFCVTGTTTSGTFDKAKFTINGTVQAETTAIRPSSTDFCQSYTIPVGVSVFNVSAQIHHATLGWF